ncbi:Mor transcription activator family protein [Mannheimia sp. AT1]|uniref:Mor transcription activator family protein n=1 Tax=Mannheimia cairinae TaxID=3025936 RepID=A0ABT5MP24_9PAST|nr:Mor transcription activator family protein [Mannheimia cairinae]MDD0823738.1 Mor transcription activator family protein [Mannheimia cairinae]MDD0825330.1 Mor transcription activator family protein [Mannheimia cairinae]
MELVDIFEEKAPEVLTDLAKHIEVELEEKHQFTPEQAKQVGIDIAQRIAQNWGGEVIYIPRNLLMALNERDMKIYEEFNGNNHRELARKYNVSMQWVYKIVKKVHKDEVARRQMSMFEM